MDALVLLALDAALDGVSVSGSGLAVAVALLELPPRLVIAGLRRLALVADDQEQMAVVSCSFMLLMLLAVPLTFLLVPLAAYLTPGWEIAGFWPYLATASSILAADFLVDFALSRKGRRR